MLVRLLLRPITDLQRFATRARGAPDSPVAPPVHFGTRELQATALSVMDMAQTLRSREATIRSFSDHISHELKTPVAVIRAATELLQEGGTLSPDDLVMVDQIAGASDQMEGHLHAMRQVVKAREVQYIGTSLLEDVGHALHAEDAEICLTGPRVRIPLAQAGLEIVLGHLVSNALAHGATYVEVQATETPQGVCVTVADNGSGISAGNAARIFDRFFTTQRAQGGTGMGLSIVQSLLRAHGAAIAYRSGGQGTAFDITFPAP